MKRAALNRAALNRFGVVGEHDAGRRVIPPARA
jgi:hypothetical protein